MLRYCRKKHTHTQNQLNTLYAPNDWVFAYDYSAMLVGVTITLIYGTALPVLYPVSAVGLYFQYVSSRYLVFRAYKRPVRFGAAPFKSLRYISIGLLVRQAWRPDEHSA